MEGKQQGASLEKLQVKELKALLKARGLPVTGRKAELIDRLRNPHTGPKPKPWQHSQAKKDLKKDLLNPNSPIHNMCIDAIKKSDKRYTQYPNFNKYYKDLEKRVEEEKRIVRIDDIAAEEHMKNNPTPEMNARGYQNWKRHPVKALLEVDVANKLHKKIKPKQLRKTRDEYKTIPLPIFGKRLQQEVGKQRSALYWAYKRSKKGMQKYLREVDERATQA